MNKNSTKLVALILVTSLCCFACGDDDDDSASDSSFADPEKVIVFNKTDYVFDSLTRQTVPYASIYLYDIDTKKHRAVEENVANCYGAIVNLDYTQLVYTDGTRATLHDFQINESSEITSNIDSLAYFDATGNVIYSTASAIKKYDVKTGITSTIAEPETLSAFGGALKMSFDGTMFVEYEMSGEIGDQDNPQEILFFIRNADGNDPNIITSTFFGWWNMFEWSKDGSRILLYYHEGTDFRYGNTKYIMYNVNSETPADLTSKDIGIDATSTPNIGTFLPSGNYLSFTRNGKVYDATTGAEIDALSAKLAEMNGKLTGTAKTGTMYIADYDFSNIEEFSFE